LLIYLVVEVRRPIHSSSKASDRYFSWAASSDANWRNLGWRTLTHL